MFRNLQGKLADVIHESHREKDLSQMKMTQHLLIGLLSGLMLLSGGVGQKGEPQQDPTRTPCTSDANCPDEFSCWYQIPRGPFAGIRGSKETPGRCWSNKVISQTD